ncbi:hypothetical protein BT69DRAFT_899747 [Atractiella rhizophila]|nr:hypothetical protein BT69DRAFT_899747 [Atractiella rhizophila]
MSKLLVRVTVYGHERPKLYPRIVANMEFPLSKETMAQPGTSIGTANLDRRLIELTMSFLNDFKSSSDAKCQFCGVKPARENVQQTLPFTHLQPPKARILVHPICNTISGPCRDSLFSMQKAFRESLGKPGGPKEGFGLEDWEKICPPPKIGELKDDEEGEGTGGGGEGEEKELYPRNGTCAFCKLEREGIPKTCSRCKLTRYCSPVCQKADWKRHKEICDAIKLLKRIDEGK